MLAFVLRFVDRLLGEFGQAHVGVHLAVDEVLVDGGEFARQQGVEGGEDRFVAFHGVLLDRGVGPA